MKKEQALQELRDVKRERERQISWSDRLWTLATGTTKDDSDSGVAGLSCRPLFPSEIETLIETNCQSDDWSLLRLVVATPKCQQDHSAVLRRRLSSNTFQDTVVLILPSTSSGTSTSIKAPTVAIHDKLPVGIHSNIWIANSILHLDARVYQNTCLQDTVVHRGGTLVNCGSVSCTHTDTATYGRLCVRVGAESGGGRSLSVTSESTMMDVCHQLLNGNTENQEQLAGLHAETPRVANNFIRPFNIICPNALVRDTPTVDGILVHTHASIQAATSVTAATLYPNACIKNACTVSSVLLQWNAVIQDHSVVTDTLLMEQAAAGPHSLVASTVLGPDVHCSAGEIHASIIGPNCNAHHQSLLIGVLWPAGRGNVGYGANVGSNHTGRLPDQETAAGEGTFWGLSCVIKMPVDLSHAPYSIVAAGTTVPPQRVSMPFSLLVDGSIVPAWVLQNSPYTLARSATKFANRRKAVRHLHYTGWKILRPDLMEQCLWARTALQTVPQVRQSYRGESDVRGIGSHTLTEKARQTGIRTYTDCIQRFCLQGLLVFLLDVQKRGIPMNNEEVVAKEFSSGRETAPTSYTPDTGNVSWPIMPWNVDESDLWNYQRSLLLQEFPCPLATTTIIVWTKELLHMLVALEEDYADRIYQSKHRDDTRGANTIPGYADSHVAAEYDPVILTARAVALQVKESVLTLLHELESPISKL